MRDIPKKGDGIQSKGGEIHLGQYEGREHIWGCRLARTPVGRPFHFREGGDRLEVREEASGLEEKRSRMAFRNRDNACPQNIEGLVCLGWKLHIPFFLPSRRAGLALICLFRKICLVFLFSLSAPTQIATIYFLELTSLSCF